MWRDRAVRTDLEQATMRVRLAATALGTTVLLLVPGQDQVAAASLLLGYGTVAVVLRAHGARLPASSWLGVAMDVLFATGLCLLLPLQAAWAMYLLAIGNAALRLGLSGILVSVAASVVGYDVALVARAGEAIASDLWRMQVLLAFAVLAAELVWAAARVRAEQRDLRVYSMAQRDLAAAAETGDLLDRLVDHAVRSFGASAAWIAGPGGQRAHTRGPVERVTPESAPAVVLGEDLALHAVFEDVALRARGTAALRDLAADARPLLDAARDRARERGERETERLALDAVHRLGRETTRAGVLAQAVSTAQELAGASAIVRVADGERAVGDLEAEVATAIARDGVAPRLVRGGPDATAAAIVTAGRGLSLVALGTRRALGQAELAALTLIGEATATALERVTERGILVATAAELRRRGEELERELRQRDDAVASAVHELRNPLTSVQAYGQLMSRHLAAVQRQVSQLDSLIGDLLGPAGPQTRPGSDRSDIARETIEAAARLRVSVPDTVVTVESAPAEHGHDARIDAGRYAQVIDNVLRNAAKYSPAGAPIEVTVTRRDEEVLVMVTDSGDGIAPEDLERIFDRYARGAQHSGSVAGAGIGLAISRDIVAAHGGRIWAESAGIGTGSTFTIALPVAPVSEETEPATNGGASAR